VLALGLALAGCGFGAAEEEPPPDAVWLVMKNRSGQHLTNFVLDHQTGRIDYQIFSRDYTFGEWVQVPRALPVEGSYYDEQGVQHHYRLQQPVTRDVIGGRFVVTFEPDDAVQAREFPPDPTP
jgi:hypothetical protein